MKVKPETRIHELLKDHPGAGKVLEKYGMMCSGCGGAESETLRHAAQNHGLSLEELISALQKAEK